MIAYDRRLRTPARALLVLEQLVLANVLERALQQHFYKTRLARTIEDARLALAEWPPHVVILDFEQAGSALLDRLRPSQDGGSVPVIALTHKADLKTKLAAFDRGVDDVLTVPFPPEEFVARLLAVMRRTYREAVEFTPVLRLGDFEIDMLNRHVRAGGVELRLTSMERSLLYLLAANAGRLLTRDEILDYLWGSDYIAESNVVDRHIRNLRAKLQNYSRPRCIATVPGRGYRFVAGAEGEPPPASL